MQDMLSVATRFLRTRQEWLGLGRRRGDLTAGEALRLSVAEAEMRALAWVLGVDLDLMNAPKLPEVVPEQPERVRLTHILALDCWLMEFPSFEQDGWKTAFWAAFLAEQQLRELGQAVMLALVPGARPALDALTGRRTPRETIVRLMAPAVMAPAGAVTPLATPSDCRDDELPPSA